ncbi:MAG: segregation and condensation protein [Frankiales bacterium]|jgi:segregation and condensation protein B|nr:segregation and condensation protein [Frankiales bacterium]
MTADVTPSVDPTTMMPLATSARERDEMDIEQGVPSTPGTGEEADITSDTTVVLPDVDGEPSLSAAVEAILMVVDTPVADVTLAQVLDRPREDVATALTALAGEYLAQGRGFELREVAGGWRLYSAASCERYVERFVREGQPARLTQASLETLAVVAYRQPVSRARISAVRGVNVEGVMRTLISRGLIEEAGTEPESGAILYRTTTYFLERLGLPSLDDLPELAPFLPDVESFDTESL